MKTEKHPRLSWRKNVFKKQVDKSSVSTKLLKVHLRPERKVQQKSRRNQNGFRSFICEEEEEGDEKMGDLDTEEQKEEEEDNKEEEEGKQEHPWFWMKERRKKRQEEMKSVFSQRC